MKKVLLLAALLLELAFANQVDLIDLQKSNNDWKAEVVISPPVVVDKVVIKDDRNGTVQTDMKTDLDTSVFVLIDTSIPMQRAFKTGIQPLLSEMIRIRDPKESWSVAYFDTDMHVVYDDAHNTPDELEGILHQIPVKGQRTELWRNTQDALKQLRNSGAKRKVLILLSDGDAEDTTAYTREDVIKMAKDAHIRIVSIAYRDTMGSQNMRKIAEETRGVFWKADKVHNNLPVDFYSEMTTFYRSQGIVTIPESILHPTASGKEPLTLVFEHGADRSTLAIELETEVYTPPPPQPVKPVEVPKSKTQLFIEKYKYYLAGGAVLLLLILLTLLFRRKKEPEVVPEPDFETGENTMVHTPAAPMQEERTVTAPKDPIAYFEAFDGIQHAVYQVPATIGKSAANDVVIERPYVSRRHAILTHREGYFYIADDNSSNGVFVNGRKIQVPTRLENGSRVGFGPYETSFRVVVEGETVAASVPPQADDERTRLN